MASRLHRLTVVPAAAALAFVAGSCGGGDGIGATLADFTITLDESSAAAGELTFDVSNDAEQIHEFVIFKTDLAEDQLPTDEDGNVDEAGEGVELIDEIEDIEAGANESLTVTLDAGSYVFLCNIPGHYGQGMHTSLTAS
ncbi:MAG TPA: plastocyanin/azurin family copper-binding protein [Actinomycetota bacterium]